MANKILTKSGYEQRVRDKLGVFEPYLPDSVINQPDCITVAEANIIARLPGYEGLEGEAKTYLEAAVVCECAVLLCSSLPARLPTKETGPHEGHDLKVDWGKTKVEIEAERDKYVGMVIDLAFPELQGPPLLYFTVTRPRRW